MSKRKKVGQKNNKDRFDDDEFIRRYERLDEDEDDEDEDDDDYDYDEYEYDEDELDDDEFES